MDEELTNWLLGVVIVLLGLAVWAALNRPPPPAKPPQPPPKPPAPPAPVSDAVEGKLNTIKRLSDPTLSRDPGAVFSTLAPEIIQMIKGYEKKVADFAAAYEEYCRKVK